MSGLCQWKFSGCPVLEEGTPRLWTMLLLSFIFFQTEALLSLLILGKLRGCQRRDVEVKELKDCG